MGQKYQKVTGQVRSENVTMGNVKGKQAGAELCQTVSDSEGGMQTRSSMQRVSGTKLSEASALVWAAG